MSTLRTSHLGGAKAVIVHRPHAMVQSLMRQLQAIGLEVEVHWPELEPSALGADFVFYDADTAYDGQFPWEAGTSPMPLIAMIGSEAPGRIEWAMRMGAHGQLLKPISDKGAYAALLLARANFELSLQQAAKIAALERRIDARQTVVKAVMLFVLRGKSESEAYDALRQTAMAWRITIEEAAERLVASQTDERPRDERNSIFRG